MNCDPCPRCGGVMGNCACQRPHGPIYIGDGLLEYRGPAVASVHRPETYALVDLPTLRLLVLGALQAEAISLDRAAELLGLPLEEMRAQARLLGERAKKAMEAGL